jgi:hypothetical protein
LKEGKKGAIYYPMKAKLVTTKLEPTALRLLQLIAKATGEKQYRVLLRLLQAEAKHLTLKV